jgi:acetyl esterase
MDTYLDPQSRAFADAGAKGPPLYEKTYVEARKVLEGIQNYKPSSDISIEEIRIPVGNEHIVTVIFRPKVAKSPSRMIFYTHGGGWILGR